jgi:DNA polymerase III delta prime subunit
MTTLEVIGNQQAKAKMCGWMRGEPTTCLLSGPTGVGKTSLAHAILRDAGRMIMDVRAKPEDFMSLMEDLVCTPPLKPLGVVVDEVENLPGPKRASLVRLLNKHKSPQAHVILICTDPIDRSLRPILNACSTHVRMFTPCEAEVRSLILHLSSQIQLQLPSASVNEIVEASHGDMRRAVTILWGIKSQRVRTPTSTDVRFHSPFDASNVVLRTRNVEEGVKAASSDRMMVRVMTAKQLPHVCGDNMDALSKRLELLSCSDVMEGDSSYSVLDHSLWLHVAATSRTPAASRGPRLQFPSTELGLDARCRSNKEAMTEVVNTYRGLSTTCNSDIEMAEVVRERLSKEKASVKKLYKQGVSRQTVKRVMDMKYKS